MEQEKEHGDGGDYASAVARLNNELKELTQEPVWVCFLAVWFVLVTLIRVCRQSHYMKKVS